MNWVKLPSGNYYTFASDIQQFAEQQGYKVPCEADGTRHPGTDCNAKMRKAVKDAGMRKTFNLTAFSVVDVDISEEGNNAEFLQWLVNMGIVSDAFKKRNTIQLYSREAVDAILTVMLKLHLHYVPAGDSSWESPLPVFMECHNFELKKNKPKASLFNKGGN